MPMIDSGYLAVSERYDSNPADVNARPQGVAAAHKSSFAEVAALVNTENSRNPAVPIAATPTPAVASFKFWEKEDFSFGDIVDIINPLQHIPIVATLYRNWTGDKIGPAPRVIGGALWGKAAGFVGGLVNAVVEWFTGKDIGDHIYAMLFGAPKAVADTAIAAQGKIAPSVSETKSAMVGSVSALGAEVLAPPPAAPPALVEVRAPIESTQRTGDPKSDSVAAETNQAEDVPALDRTPWPAASALHIFRKYDRSLDRIEDSRAPLLNYIA